MGGLLTTNGTARDQRRSASKRESYSERAANGMRGRTDTSVNGRSRELETARATLLHRRPKAEADGAKPIRHTSNRGNTLESNRTR
jgi:hypothetical protein